MWKKNILFFSCKIALSRHDQVILIRIRLEANFTDSRITKKCQPAMNCSNNWTRYVSRPVWEWESYFSCSYSMYLPKKKASWGSFLQDSAHCGHNHRSFTLLEFGDSFQKSLIVYQDFSSMALKFSYGCMVILVTKYWWRVNCFFGEKNFHEIFYFL